MEVSLQGLHRNCVGSLLLVILVGLVIYITWRKDSYNELDEAKMVYAVVASVVVLIAALATLLS